MRGRPIRRFWGPGKGAPSRPVISRPLPAGWPTGAVVSKVRTKDGGPRTEAAAQTRGWQGAGPARGGPVQRLQHRPGAGGGPSTRGGRLIPGWGPRLTTGRGPRGHPSHPCRATRPTQRFQKHNSPRENEGILAPIPEYEHSRWVGRATPRTHLSF